MSTFCNYWNKVSLVKSKIKKSKKIDSIGIGLASPEEIRRWGERRLPNGTLIGKVDKDHTVDYESLKPIEGGLFCERIFGPVEDFYCSCERKGEKNEKFCPNCEVEFTKSRVRRIRMGYIPLAVPVVHVWYLRGRPSYIANLVGKSRNSIDRLAYGETLSESFIGYSSLESIYKKEEDFFPKRIQRILALPQRDNASMLTPHTQTLKGLAKSSFSVTCGGLRRDNANAQNGRAAHTLYTSSVTPHTQTLKGLAKSSDKSSICTCKSFIPFGYPGGVKEQKYFKCHTLPLFSTFVYKEWSHRFSFLEYFIWSARNNDLVLPFYAYQNSRSERRLANICESIRKSSINLIKNKFSLRFSNKSNFNHSSTRIISNEASGPLVLQEQKIKPHFLQLRNKQSALRFSKVNKDIDFLFYTKPNSSDIRIPLRNPLQIEDLYGVSCASNPTRKLNLPTRLPLWGMLNLRFVLSMRCKATCRYPMHIPQGISYSTSKILPLRNPEGVSYASSLYQKGWDFSGALKLKISLRPRGAQIATINSCDSKGIPFRYHNYSTNALIRYHNNFVIPRALARVNNDELAQLTPHPQAKSSDKSDTNLRFVKSQHFAACKGLKSPTRASVTPLGYPHTHAKSSGLRLSTQTPSGLELNRRSLTPHTQAKSSDKSDTNLRFVKIRRSATCMGSASLPDLSEDLSGSYCAYPCRGMQSPKGNVQRVGLAVLTNCGNKRVNCLNEGSLPSLPTHFVNTKTSFSIPLAKQGVKEFDAPLYAFSTMQQDTESTPLNKMDTQQFPRLTELLNFTGGAALRNLLSRFDLIVLSRFLRHELKNLELKVNSLLALKMLTYSQGLLLGKLAKRRSKQIRRLKLLELFQSQKSNPEWMILSVIPVLPPDLRPILRVNDDFVVASDLNRLYQTVLRRNNTIHERLDDPLPCPESGLFRQRSLQKAVDGLLENGKGGGTPLCASKRRPLVSLSHVLKGKKGLFRQHLLGKRVDYSGRSVIVVGPRLQLHECGLPKEMAIELFQPFLLHRLKVKGLATSNTTARRMIQQGNPVIWHLLKQLVYEHPVLLNRAPTLHRLGIQAFQPRLVSGRAILLHPLVCNGFNADFDGDQMAVHVPLSFQARAEAWKIMWSKNNFLSPATGQPILVPSQDMVLGCYYLSVSIPRILNANVNIVSHDKAMTNGSFTGAMLELPLSKARSMYALDFTNLSGTYPFGYPGGVKVAQRFTSSESTRLTNRRFSLRVGVVDPFVTPHTLTPLGYAKSNTNLRFSIPQRGKRVESLNPVQIEDLSGSVRGGSATCMGSAALPKVQNFVLHSKAFLNENKGQYFSNLQDSLLAYFQGRLQTHTPFWVRIDHRFASRRFTTFCNSTKIFSTINSEGIVSTKCDSRRNRQQSVSSQIQHSATNDRALELTFLQPLYGSSREICKTLFQNKSTNNSNAPLIRVEANETLESPLELRLSVDGNLANILTMFQNHYNYNATWVKQCKEESIKYMRTTAGRVVINDAVFRDF